MKRTMKKFRDLLNQLESLEKELKLDIDKQKNAGRGIEAAVLVNMKESVEFQLEIVDLLAENLQQKEDLLRKGKRDDHFDFLAIGRVDEKLQGKLQSIVNLIY